MSVLFILLHDSGQSKTDPVTMDRIKSFSLFLHCINHGKGDPFTHAEQIWTAL